MGENMNKKLTKFITIILSITIMVSNVYAYDYEFTDLENGIQVSNNIKYASESDRRFGQVTKSFLNKNDDGTFTRLEVINNNIFVETYSSNYEYISTKQLPLELPKFGGAYFGSEYNFIVYAQNNLNENDDREVLELLSMIKNGLL